MGSSTAVEKAEQHGTTDQDVSVGAARSAMSRRLVDSLLHDVRNPLNALSINLDVLTEKLRREQGEIPPTQEKNLKVMREQIFRVDAILKHFSEYLAPRADGATHVDVSAVVQDVIGVLGHECRRSMIKVRQMVEPDLHSPSAPGTVRLIALQGMFRAVVRAGAEGEVDVTLQREGDCAVLRIKDSAATDAEPFRHAPDALRALAAECGAEVRLSQNEFSILLPLHS